MNNKYTGTVFLMIIVVFFSVVLWGHSLNSEETDSNSLLRLHIYLSDEEYFNRSELDQYRQIRIEGMPENMFDLIVTGKEYSELVSQGYDIEIISTDYLQSVSQLSELFYTNESANAFIDSLYQLYPDIIKIDSIGTTHEHRIIWCVKISENVEVDDPHKPGVFYSGGIHANELAGTNVVLTLMDTIVTGYGSGNQQMIDILHNYQIWIVPVLNPDGVAYVHDYQDLSWRKNRRDNGNGCYGVDINRNFGYMWGIDDEGSSSDPCNNFSYRGPAPFSEPESQAIRNFFNGPGSENRNFVTLITYHMKYSQGAFLYPWYYVDAYTEHLSVYEKMGIDFTTITGGTYGNAKDCVGYLANGSLDEWVYSEANQNLTVMAGTIEIGRGGLMPDYPIDLLLSTHIPANLQQIQKTKTIMDNVRIVDGNLLTPLTVCDWVTGSNDTLFYGADSVIQVALISDISNPKYISEITLNGSPENIQFHQSKLYTIYSSILGDPYWCKVIDSIGVYDVTDLYNPIYSGTYRFSEYVYDFQFSNNYLVLLDSSGMKIMTESEQNQLIEVGHYNTLVKPSSITIDRHTICIARDSYGEGLYIVDISDPSDPQLLGQPYFLRDSTGVFHPSLYLNNGLLFVIGNDDPGYPNCTILDINDPENISYLNYFRPGEFYGGPLSFYENVAYIASDLGYYTYDCNIPSTLGYYDRGDLELPEEWNDLWSTPAPVFLNNYGFVAKGDEGLYVLDATDPLYPVWLGKFGEIETGVRNRELKQPFAFHLNQNYPNPFNPVTTISYDLPKSSDVTLQIYDITGRLIETLVNQNQNAGNYQVWWDASAYSSGVYFYRIMAGDFIKTKKMVLMK